MGLKDRIKERNAQRISESQDVQVDHNIEGDFPIPLPPQKRIFDDKAIEILTKKQAALYLENWAAMIWKDHRVALVRFKLHLKDHNFWEIMDFFNPADYGKILERNAIDTSLQVKLKLAQAFQMTGIEIKPQNKKHDKLILSRKYMERDE